MPQTLFDYLHLMIDGILAGSIIFGGVKFYYVLKFYPPHSHYERGKDIPLTSSGIMYPRDGRSFDDER